MSQVRILSFRPKKQERGSSSLLFFWLMCQFGSVLRSKMQVRIPRTEIDKLACQAKCVGITKRSGVTLSFRPKKDCNFDTKLQSFLTKSAFVGINPLCGWNLLFGGRTRRMTQYTASGMRTRWNPASQGYMTDGFDFGAASFRHNPKRAKIPSE